VGQIRLFGRDYDFPGEATPVMSEKTAKLASSEMNVQKNSLRGHDTRAVSTPNFIEEQGNSKGIHK
jgi:hypothetical protein